MTNPYQLMNEATRVQPQDPQRGRLLLQTAVVISEFEAAQSLRQYCHSAIRLAVSHQVANDLQAAEQLYNQCLRILDLGFFPVDDAVLYLYSNLSDVYQKQNRFEEGCSIAQQGVTIAEQLALQPSDALAYAWANLGSAQRELGKLSEAKHSYETAIEMMEAVNPSDPNLVSIKEELQDLLKLLA